MKEQYLDTQVNEMIGTNLGVGFITPKQILYCGIILLFCLPIILVRPLHGVFLFASIYSLWWILTGNDPADFFERMISPQKYISVEPELDFNRGGIPIPKLKSTTATEYVIKGKKQKHHHIEQKYYFLSYGQIELDRKEIGFYLLKRGVNVMFIFTWSVEGHDPSMTATESDSIVCACTDALNQLPGDIDLKIYQDVEKNCEDYLRMQAELLISKELDPLSQATIKSRAERAKDLTEEGRILNNKITVLAKYRMILAGDYAVTRNWLDEVLSRTQPLIGVIKGKKFDTHSGWSRAIRFAYNYAYKKVNFVLSDNKGGFGLKARTLSVQDIYERDYLELHVLNKNKPQVPQVPQYIVYNEWGLVEPVINQLGTHAVGSLFEPQDGFPAVPRFDKHLVYYPVKNKYAGFLRIGQIQQFPQEKESVSRGYIKYIWNILSGTTQAVHDCRVVSEITADRSGFEIVSLDRIISHSIKREALAAKKQTVDVIAMRRREQAVEARDLLASGHIPYWVSFGIWLYRDSPEQLEQDLIDLAQQITGAAAERVENCIEHIWLQSAPYEWEAFLTKPTHRRQKYVSFQALPSIPLIKIPKIDSLGVMLVSRSLNSAIYLDFANKKNHTAIIAKTGAGKSNLILEILIEYIAHGYMVVLFDFPRPDGSSTYTVLLPLLQRLGVKAAYHNVRENTINIIEMPTHSHISSLSKKEKIRKRAKENHVRLLSTIVMGTVENPDREILVQSLLTDCYSSFHSEPLIKQRYEIATNSEYGSEAYQKMPILEDFVSYAEQWFADYIDRKQGRISNLVNDTIDVILTQLRGILKTPLGKSINGISSFDTKVEILVIGLTSVSETLDSLIYAMSGLNALYRAAFSATRSLLGIDEGTILYKFQAFARETGIIPVHGRKWGCNFLIAAQEIATILNSCSGGEIFKNLDNIFGGHIESAAIPEMIAPSVGFRKEIIIDYTSTSFKPSGELLQSYWYLKRGDQHIEVTHPGSKLLLALGVTEPEEDAARQRVLSQYPDNPIEGLHEFAELYISTRQQGLSLNSIYPEVILDEE